MLAIDDMDAPRSRRDDLKSAVRTAARVIGRDLDQIPADPRTITAWLSAALTAYLSEITEKVIREEVHGETGEAEEVDQPKRIAR